MWAAQHCSVLFSSGQNSLCVFRCVDDDKGSRRLAKKIEERLIRGKYREGPTIDYGVKHKASLLIMRIYTCVLMLYKGRRSRIHPVYSVFKFQSKFMFCKCKTVVLLLM